MSIRGEDFGTDLTLAEGDDGIWSPSQTAPRARRATGGLCTSGNGRVRRRRKRAVKNFAGPLSANITETPAPLGISVGRWR